jgi:glycosyltransferase involved in cell wall biosynthesis
VISADTTKAPNDRQHVSETIPHICVCICTFKRGDLLLRLLQALQTQRTNGQFSYSIVVADNDALSSAAPVVGEFAAQSSMSVAYCVEAKQNIALARNMALENASGDFIAFIDDDETPATDWLLRLFETHRTYDSDGVLGPVKPSYECTPPDWMIKGGFFERPSYTTGKRLHWSETRTGNVLFKRSILRSGEPPFRAEFDVSHEDLDFFRRRTNEGCTFVWCDEAEVFEVVPSSRCNRTYLLKRALLRGSNFPKHPTGRLSGAIKSLIAVPCYLVALPFLALFGQHLFFSYAIKICDHGSRLLALAGWPLITSRHGIA